jgi:hypothetical protein
MRGRAIVLVALAAVFGCSGGDGEPTEYPPTLYRLSVSPDAPGVLLADQQAVTLTATGHYHDNMGRGEQWTKDLTAAAVWTSSNPDCASIIGPGEVDCHALGDATIHVHYDLAEDESGVNQARSISGRAVLVVTTSTKLARTGQTTSHAAGDDGDIQAGVEWPTTRFTYHGDGTVSDNLTGLMWLDDANCLETYYPDAPINDNKGVINGYANVLAFIEGINDGTYKVTNQNYDDWRVPSIVELESLHNHEAANNKTWLETEGGFVNVDVLGLHISSTKALSDHFTIDLVNGVVSHRTGVGHVWPVRSNVTPDKARAGLISPTPGVPDPGTIAWPNPRFEVGTGTRAGTMYDKLTGLTWVASPPQTSRTWQEAIDYANDLTLGGYDDWRLPNRKEMRSIVVYGASIGDAGRYLEEQGFAYVDKILWTSTSWAPNPLSAWTVMIHVFPGVDDTNTFRKTSTYGIPWPVRGP